MPIKIITFGDVHVGVTTYGTIDSKTGLNTRVLDALHSLDKMINYAIDNTINYIVFAGDAYKNNLPSPTLQKEFDSRIQRAAENGIKVYIMSGNHDVSPLETAKSPLETFSTLKVNNVYHSRFKQIYMINDNLKLLMLPTYCNQEITEKILDDENDGIPTLVVGHCTIKGAMLNDWLIEQNESAIDVSTFERPNIIGVVLGHLHKYQILNKKPLTYYTGSLQRIDFTEETQEKGFVVLTIDGTNISQEFIEVSSQKFHTIKLNLVDISDEMDIIKDRFDMDAKELKNSIVRLILDVDKDNKIENQILFKQLREYNVKSIASIQKNIDRSEIVRNKEITETITEEKALEVYFKEHKNSERITTLGLEMIKLLKNNNVI